jgi:hypothetical protein
MKLAEAEKKLAEKSSELIRKTGEFEMKRKADGETIQRQQKELNGLRRYMETAEQHWDLLNEDIMGMNPELVLITYALGSICMLISGCLVQSLLDTTRNVGTSSLGMICFSLPEKTARISSPPPGRSVTTYPSRKPNLRHP